MVNILLAKTVEGDDENPRNVEEIIIPPKKKRRNIK